MNTIDNNYFKWGKLVELIHDGNVIPIIGHGLYLIETETGDKVLLYDYLTKKLVEDMGIKLSSDYNPKFSETVLEFLKKKSSSELKQFLLKILHAVVLIPESPLLKLACIRPFSIFINTTYDTFLLKALKSVRSKKTEFVYYTIHEKRTRGLNSNIFNRLENGECTLLCNIFGNVEKNLNPAYVDENILETVMSIKQDMESEPGNKLLQELKANSLLFIGCGFDDWLFRFFARSLALQPYKKTMDIHNQSCKFFCDNFHSPPGNALANFFKEYDSEVFHSADGTDFVDRLFQEVKNKNPEDIITNDEFPGNIFISFHGADRRTVAALVSRLRDDEINVWLDEREMEPGDEVDETIVKAIKKCPIFIPIISENSKQIQSDDKKLKYHIREWEWAYSEKIDGFNPKVIIPVIIDKTSWMYESFKGYFYVRIPGGGGKKEYEKLRNRLLLEIQKNTR